MNQGKKLKTVIFDMDGVIFDSERTILDAWEEISREIYLPDMERVYISCCGTTRETTEKIMKTAYGEDFPFDELDLRAYRMRDLKYKDGLPLKPGIRELLELLHENGITIALATSTKGKRALMQLEQVGLLSFFDVQITGDMVTRSKPDPEIFLIALEQSGTEAEEAIIIEDSFNGVKAARNAGAEVIMVPDLKQPDESLIPFYDHVFPSLFDVGTYITQTYLGK